MANEDGSFDNVKVLDELNDRANVAECLYGYWGNHPEYMVTDWQYEVANGDTRLGYWHWCANHEMLDAAS